MLDAGGEPPAQRELFGLVERFARRHGHGAVIDEWGEALALLRPSVRPM